MNNNQDKLNDKQNISQGIWEVRKQKNNLLDRLVLTLKVHNVDDHNFGCSYQSGPLSVS